MYGIHDGSSFEVFVRRDSSPDRLVFRFECKEGMGVLGIRKADRTDPQPSSVYQESDIDPDHLKVGRFVHVLTSGQRQSYALSRIDREVGKRLPDSAWVELEPLTEYGFRYLIVPEGKLVDPGQRQAAAVAVAAAPGAPAAAPAPAPEASAPAAVKGVARPAPVASASDAPAVPPRQTPMSPALAKDAVARLDRDSAVKHLMEEMAKVATLHAEVDRLKAELETSAGRERDLLGLLSKWREG